MNLSPAVARGGTRLTFDAVAAITDTAEQYHATIAGRSLPWSPRQPGSRRTRGIVTPLVYRAIRGVTATLREGVDGVFGIVPGSAGPLRTAAEIRIVAALNGVLGDHLEESGNPLAIPMTLVHDGRPLYPGRDELAAALPAAGGHVAVLVHGLALSELSWRRGGAVSLGERLQQALGFTPLYLRYNTGRHISSNGRELARLLERLCEAWPVPVQSLSLIGHSMGGLVIRSAGWYARQAGAAWTDRLSRVAFLGTPHHGAPLERAGQAFDVAVRQLPYVAPLALGRHRSAGIKDLSHGDLLDEDWRDHPPDEIRRDRRRPVPLLPHVDHYFAAATLGRGERDPLGRLLGDLLVQTHSAVGEHRHRARRLAVDPARCRVFVERHHFDR
jgi:hypothetical protein